MEFALAISLAGTPSTELTLPLVLLAHDGQNSKVVPSLPSNRRDLLPRGAFLPGLKVGAVSERGVRTST